MCIRHRVFLYFPLTKVEIYVYMYYSQYPGEIDWSFLILLDYVCSDNNAEMESKKVYYQKISLLFKANQKII